MATSLPNDVISEILSWLPVKSACRLRSVSKGWHALVSNPSFLAAHKAHNEPHLLLVASPYLGGSEGRRELQLVDLDGNIVRVVKAVGNPWRICSGPDGPVCATRHGSVLNLIDLATGVLMTSTEMGSQERYIEAMGFGYATPSGAPKVVRLTSVCDVLTVEDGARWRRVESHPADLSYYENYVVTIDGVLYFLYNLENEEHVLCFDLESEEWKGSIQGPMRSGYEFQKKTLTIRMVELNDTLCVVHSEGSMTIHPCTTVWLLSDFTKGIWIKAYTIPMASTNDLIMPLRVMRHRSRKLLFYCFHSCGATPTLQVYDPLDSACTRVVNLLGNLSGRVGVCGLHLRCFVPSKTSPVAELRAQLARSLKY
ncbi:hypothetical protein VPH35_132184 [Triticum aestivum]